MKRPDDVELGWFHVLAAAAVGLAVSVLVGSATNTLLGSAAGGAMAVISFLLIVIGELLEAILRQMRANAAPVAPSATGQKPDGNAPATPSGT